MPKLHFNNVRHADLPLHYGQVPPWLAQRMSKLGGAIVESIILEYGQSEALTRLSDPLWFQAFGCVLDMDWHSSGITTSVMGALKKAMNPKFNEYGIYFCGGKGKHSRQTPSELAALGQRTGLNGDELIRSSRLTATRRTQRLGSILALAHDRQYSNFESFLLMEGVGPRTIQSLALVSEVIHGAPSRFTDPARFSFAHGGKDGHPFPVPLKTYDETIQTLQSSVEKSKLGDTDKQQAIKNLSIAASLLEKSFEADETQFDKVIATERRDSYKYGGRTVFGKAKPPSDQLTLF